MSNPEPSMASDHEREFLKAAGDDLLPAFEKYINSTGGNICKSDGYMATQEVSFEFNALQIYRREHNFEEEMEQRVLFYLLGLAYPPDPAVTTMKVKISDPAWLESLCAGLVSNQRVKTLHIDIESPGSSSSRLHREEDFRKRMADCLEHIPLLLKQNSSLRRLHISSSIELDGYEKHIAEAVGVTNTLQELSLQIWSGETDSSSSEGTQIADALRKNTSITGLRISALLSGSILQSFGCGQSLGANHSVEELTLVGTLSGALRERMLVALKTVLSSNQTLTKIRLENVHLSLREWLEVVEALKLNTHLQTLDIGESTGWEHAEFLNAMCDLLRVHCTQIIGLGITIVAETPEVVKESFPALKRQLDLNSQYGQVLSTAPKGPPRSARVILCGPGYAGKTTLCNTMMRKPRQWVSLFLQRNPLLWWLLYGTEACEEWEKRTRGVEMQVWREEISDDPRICLWDFAGQKEYYALHDYMFPVVNCANLFLFCFSLIPSPDQLDTSMQTKSIPERVSQIEKEFRFWLRFLCSNSNQNINPKPRVCIVLTNVDRVPNDDLETIKLQCWMKLEESFQDFETRVDLVKPIVFLNCHSRKMVSELETNILNEFKRMTPELEPRFEICESVRRKLEDLRRPGDRYRPIITLEHYAEICIQENETILRSSEVRDAVASYLHSVGEIIYFRRLKFIVVDPRWLGVGILGNLLDVFGRKSQPKWKGLLGLIPSKRPPKVDLVMQNGFVNQRGLRSLLEQSLKSVTSSTTVKAEYLIDLLLDLEICFEADRRQGDHMDVGYHIPAGLDDEDDRAFHGLRQLQWDAAASGEMYIGRRLQCADKTTVLTSGFFPRLQVVLQKHLFDPDRKPRILGSQGMYDGFQIKRNMLTFLHDGMNVIVEHGDGECFDHSFVDVLVKCSKGFKKTLSFIQDHVLNVIRDFCAKPEGNQGVTLVEGIIRPRSVEHLVLCRYRENQSVLITQLEKHLAESADSSFQFLYNGVREHYSEPPCPRTLNMPESYSAQALIKGGKEDIKSYSQVLSSALKELRDPIWVTMLGHLRGTQLLEEGPKLLYLVEHKNFYLLRGTGEIRLRLHLQCESRENGPHIVMDQKGRSFVVEDELRETILPVFRWTYELLRLTAVGASKLVVGDAANTLLNTLLPQEVPVLPNAFISRPKLERLGFRDREEIIHFYQTVLSRNPFCEWAVKFLNLKGNPSKFKDDFGLSKMRYNDTEEIAFLCDDCQVRGLQSGKLLLV